MLADNFPAPRPTLGSATTPLSVWQQPDYFAACTRAATTEGPLLLRCFVVADELLRRRDDANLRAAPANVYLYGLHPGGSTRGNQPVRQLMPAPLYQLYTRQHGFLLPSTRTEA